MLYILLYRTFAKLDRVVKNELEEDCWDQRGSTLIDPHHQLL